MNLYKIIATFNHFDSKGKLKEYVVSDWQIVVDNIETANHIFERYVETYKKFIDILKTKSYNTSIQKQAQYYVMKAPLLKREANDSIHFNVSLFEPTIFQNGEISNFATNSVSKQDWNYIYIEEPKIDGRKKKTPTI